METMGTDRLFLQGLIQVSVGFYHLFNKNYRGAASQFTKGLKKLEGYCPFHHGIELERFIQNVQGWQRLVEQGLRGNEVALEETSVPKLEFIA